ncbi:hypothetical protein [Nocardiopsis sp. CC223A]|uniref:hypothetical protein n=1 Tax=Nocardiopsis sp. CC223A TaxID=3044051 RepID=UPI00278C7F58|nr:hypothetical protein [Nocardiopsis sp. CC223A]
MGDAVERARTPGEAVRALVQAGEVDPVAVERVLVRVLAGTPVGEFVDAAGLARLVVAVAGVEGAAEALVQVAEVASVVQVLDPVAQRAVRIRLRHRAAAGALG